MIMLTIRLGNIFRRVVHVLIILSVAPEINGQPPILRLGPPRSELQPGLVDNNLTPGAEYPRETFSDLPETFLAANNVTTPEELGDFVKKLKESGIMQMLPDDLRVALQDMVLINVTSSSPSTTPTPNFVGNPQPSSIGPSILRPFHPDYGFSPSLVSPSPIPQQIQNHPSFDTFPLGPSPLPHFASIASALDDEFLIRPLSSFRSSLNPSILSIPPRTALFPNVTSSFESGNAVDFSGNNQSYTTNNTASAFISAQLSMNGHNLSPLPNRPAFNAAAQNFSYPLFPSSSSTRAPSSTTTRQTLSSTTRGPPLPQLSFVNASTVQIGNNPNPPSIQSPPVVVESQQERPPIARPIESGVSTSNISSTENDTRPNVMVSNRGESALGQNITNSSLPVPSLPETVPLNTSVQNTTTDTTSPNVTALNTSVSSITNDTGLSNQTSNVTLAGNSSPSNTTSTGSTSPYNITSVGSSTGNTTESNTAPPTLTPPLGSSNASIPSSSPSSNTGGSSSSPSGRPSNETNRVIPVRPSRPSLRHPGPGIGETGLAQPLLKGLSINQPFDRVIELWSVFQKPPNELSAKDSIRSERLLQLLSIDADDLGSTLAWNTVKLGTRGGVPNAGEQLKDEIIGLSQCTSYRVNKLAPLIRQIVAGFAARNVPPPRPPPG